MRPEIGGTTFSKDTSHQRLLDLAELVYINVLY